VHKIKITPEIMAWASSRAQEMGRLNNSITNGEGNLAGFIGEAIVLHCKGGKSSNTYDYDLISPKGRKVDVKTKRTTVAPKPHYACTVPLLNTRQKCDIYAFTRVLNSCEVGWFLGWLDKREFFERATILRKGDVVPSNGFICKSDCYDLPIKMLHG
jgi:hypothetical protein